MTTPAIRDTTSGAVLFSSSFTPTLPTHEAGDVLVIVILGDGRCTSLTSWSVIFDIDILSDMSYLTRRVISPITDPTITLNQTGDYVWVALSISGIDSLSNMPFAAVDFESMSVTGVTSTQHTGLRSAYSNALVVSLFGWEDNVNGTTVSSANGFTEYEEIIRHATGKFGLWLGAKSISADGTVTGAQLSCTSRDGAWLTLYFVAADEVPTSPQVKTCGETYNATDPVLGRFRMNLRHNKYDYLLLLGANHSTSWDDNSGAQPSLGSCVFYTLGVAGQQEDLAVKYAKLAGTLTSDTGSLGSFNARGNLILRGGHETHPFARTAFSWDNAATAGFTVPALSTTHANQTHLVLVGDATVTANGMSMSGYTQLLRGVHASGGALFAAFKEYASGDTSATPSGASSASYLTYSLLLTPATASESDLPAVVRTVARLTTTSTGSKYLYNTRARAGETMVLCGACSAASSELAYSITSPSGLTVTDLQSERDVFNAWNVKTKVTELTADHSTDYFTINVTTIAGTLYLHAAIVDRVDIDSVVSDEVISNTSVTQVTSTETAPDKAAVVAFAVVQATGAGVDADFCEQAYIDSMTSFSVNTIVGGNVSAGDSSHVFTSDTSGRMLAHLAFLPAAGGGVGLFGATDF
jgi:hypothetical protein